MSHHLPLHMFIYTFSETMYYSTSPRVCPPALSLHRASLNEALIPGLVLLPLLHSQGTRMEVRKKRNTVSDSLLYQVLYSHGSPLYNPIWWDHASVKEEEIELQKG